MKRLSHLIIHTVNLNHRKPIVVLKGGPPISHMCFADDLLLFVEASMDQLLIIKAYLFILCASSSQKVSLENIQNSFLKNANHNRLMGKLHFTPFNYSSCASSL